MNGVTGHECVNELIVDRLLNILGFEHLHYRLIHVDIRIDGKILDTYLSSSDDFKEKGEEKTAFDIFYELEKNPDESVMDFIKRYGFEKSVKEMLVTDFLILNRDRHGANIEILTDSKKKTLRLAPMFDHGFSLLSTCRSKKQVKEFDVLLDRPVQCYFGSRSAFENLKLIPKEQCPVLNPLNISDKKILLDGLDGILDDDHLEKIWEMIWKRWCLYENICNKK